MNLMCEFVWWCEILVLLFYTLEQVFLIFWDVRRLVVNQGRSRPQSRCLGRWASWTLSEYHDNGIASLIMTMTAVDATLVNIQHLNKPPRASVNCPLNKSHADRSLHQDGASINLSKSSSAAELTSLHFKSHWTGPSFRHRQAQPCLATPRSFSRLEILTFNVLFFSFLFARTDIKNRGPLAACSYSFFFLLFTAKTIRSNYLFTTSSMQH